MDGSAPLSAGKRYDAFISYSHAADDRFAPELQRGLQRFARSWRQRRALEVFRDRTGLSANPDLWAGVRTALDASEWFVHLASPGAAASAWVGREIARWKETKDPDHLLVVLTDGTWAWDEERNTFDQAGSTAIHPELWDAFAAEPLVLDMRWARGADRLTLRDPRFRDAVAELAAPIHGRSKDDLEDEDTRNLRRTRRVAGAGVTLLAVLLVAALVAGWVAVGQRNEARHQRGEAQRQRDAAEHQLMVSQARLLGTTAAALTGTDLADAQLLAAQAWAMSPDRQTRAALFQAVTASPHLVRYVDVGGDVGADVTALASSDDGRTVVVGTRAGRVLTWQPDGAADPVPVWTLPGPVTAVAVADGGAVVATDGQQARLSGAPGTVTADPGATFSAVAITYDGATVALAEGDADGRTTLLTVRAGAVTPVAGTGSLGVPRAVVFRTPGALSTLDHLGRWSVSERRQGAWSVVATGSLPQGAHNYAATLSPDGSLAGFTGGEPTVPFFRLGGQHDVPDLVATSSGRAPTSLAVDDMESTVAIADGGTIYLSRLVEDAADGQVFDQLTGNASVVPGSLAFRGSATSLVSATGQHLTAWETTQPSRVATDHAAVVPSGCGTCTGPQVRVGPDGTVAVVSNGGDGWVLDRPDDRRPLVDRAGEGVYPQVALPVWTTDGARVLAPVDDAVEVFDARTGAPLAQWPLTELDSPAAAGLTDDGRRLVVVGWDGVVETLDTDDGRAVSTGQVEVAPSDAPPQIRVDPTDGTVAVVTTGGVSLSTPSGEPSGTLALTGTHSADLAAGRLAAVTSDETPTVWDTSTGQAIWSAGETGDVLAGPTLSADGRRVAYQRYDGEVVVVDLDEGEQLATFPLSSARETRQAGLAFSPDASSIYAALETFGDSPGELQVWDLDPAHWASAACASAGRVLTDDKLAALTGITHLPTGSCAYRP